MGLPMDGSHGHPWAILRIPCPAMGTHEQGHGCPMSMKYSLEVPWARGQNHGCPWALMSAHGIKLMWAPTLLPTGDRGCPSMGRNSWVSIGGHGFPWEEIHGCPWAPVLNHGQPPMGATHVFARADSCDHVAAYGRSQ